MKKAFLLFIILIGTASINTINAQKDVAQGPFIKECSTNSGEEANACRDSILLAALSQKLQRVEQKITKGTFMLEYSINSKGTKKVNKVILIPKQVENNETKEILMALFQEVIDERDWLPIEDIYKEEKLMTGVHAYLKLNTSEL